MGGGLAATSLGGLIKGVDIILEEKLFSSLSSLYIKQSWLSKREQKLISLIKLCRDDGEYELLYDLLENFHFLDFDGYDKLLNEAINFITQQSGFDQNRTQIVALAWDDESDSSQFVLHSLKSVLMLNDWNNFKSVNRINKATKYLSQGRNQIILVDEFIGSGKTLNSRIKQLRNDLNGSYEIKVCYLAGMEYAINKMKEELNIDIFCALKMERGISDRFPVDQIGEIKEKMVKLELELLQDRINNKEINEYSLGYGQAESLFTGEGYRGNTPNSVFPIFWWPFLKGNQKRDPVLTRYEKDFI